MREQLAIKAQAPIVAPGDSMKDQPRPLRSIDAIIAVWREATGTEDEELRGYGDPSNNAEPMALKRAAAKFGLGLYLYQK